MRRTRDIALAAHEARGGRQQNYNQTTRDVHHWFVEVPGFLIKIELLAWTPRGESPFIDETSAGQNDADSSGVRVKMIPRSFWDADPRFLDTYTEIFREWLRKTFQ